MSAVSVSADGTRISLGVASACGFANRSTIGRGVRSESVAGGSLGEHVTDGQHVASEFVRDVVFAAGDGLGAAKDAERFDTLFLPYGVAVSRVSESYRAEHGSGTRGND